MKHYLLFSLLLLSFAAKSQINVADSTVQVIGYWDRHEKQTYDIEYKKSTVKGTDTTVTQNIQYKVDVAVVDSTAASYTIEWKYRDYKINSTNKLADKLATFFNGITVRFSTDEMGAFNELINWQEIKAYQEKALKEVAKDTRLPAAFANLLNKFSTKEDIESNCIKDILQFYTFHGLALKYGEPIDNAADDKSKLGDDEIKSDFSLELTELNAEDSDYIVKFWQTYDPESINAVLGGLLTEFLGNNTIKDKITATAMEDYSGAMIHESGWPINMFYQRSLDINGIKTLETRSIILE